MPKYRKKPVVIEAYQWIPDDSSIQIPWRALKACADRMMNADRDDGCVSITTLEGEMLANPEDWIIRGVKGEIYPCKPDIFEATYDPA